LTATATWPWATAVVRSGSRHAFHAQRLTSTGVSGKASALDHGHVAVAVAVEVNDHDHDHDHDHDYDYDYDHVT
jgi:hypothetical protein